MSDTEAARYYSGLPSSPRLVARTSSTPWNLPQGLGTDLKPKQLGVVVDHVLNTVWEDNLAFKIHACLDNMGVQWTSTDVVRIGVAGEPAPIILWIGVQPKSLVGGDANAAAFGCLDILRASNINDVEVEIRESIVVRSAGPVLLSPVSITDAIATVYRPLTHSLGLPISPQSHPDIAGTGGFYMAKDGSGDELLLITARHVPLPPTSVPNTLFDESKPRANVLLLGNKAYEKCLTSIQGKIRSQRDAVTCWRQVLMATEGQDNEVANEKRGVAHHQLRERGETADRLEALYNRVKNDWATHASRVLGHVVYSPPIRFGAGTPTEQYTEDYAIIELDNEKIDMSLFNGNEIDLGTEIPSAKFTEKMNPNREHNTRFIYPHCDRLLKIQGTIPDAELRNPTYLDENGEPCLIVIKDGSQTGVTIGRASSVVSYTREYPGSFGGTSKEWSIFSYDAESEPFSEGGDSGAVIVDGLGRIGGMLTGGTIGVKDSSDITYATPINFLLGSINAKYPDAHLL